MYALSCHVANIKIASGTQIKRIVYLVQFSFIELWNCNLDRCFKSEFIETISALCKFLFVVFHIVITGWEVAFRSDNPILALHRASIMMELSTYLTFILFLECKSDLDMTVEHELPERQ